MGLLYRRSGTKWLRGAYMSRAGNGHSSGSSHPKVLAVLKNVKGALSLARPYPYLLVVSKVDEFPWHVWP
jgi:hypothetical protein